jgi:nitrous oxide reductase accessory protein NosL
MTSAARRGASAALLLAVAAAAGGAGCGGRDRFAAPATVVGETCASCGMEVRNPRYMAASVAAGRVRPYDSIECAMKEAAPVAPRGHRILYLADYATGTLHHADSLWVVRAKIPSPMGAGLAAFLDRAEAERVAAAREGTVSPASVLFAPAGAAR